MNPALYFNVAQIVFTDRDFILAVGEKMPNLPAGNGEPTAPSGQQRIAVVARLATSPQHAKELAVLLTNLVAAYETKYGPIRDPGGSIVVPHLTRVEKP